MNIKQIIDLWDESKYNTILLEGFPCVNHKGEITHGTGIYNKGQKIHCGKVYDVYVYLMGTYKGSIFMLDYVKDDYIVFKQILKGETNENNK